MFETPEWREKEARAVAQRAANEAALARGEPLPFPNPWDAVDASKVPADASPEQITASYEAFSLQCRPRARKRHTI